MTSPFSSQGSSPPRYVHSLVCFYCSLLMIFKRVENISLLSQQDQPVEVHLLYRLFVRQSTNDTKES